MPETICPNCSSKNIIKKGKNKNKLQTIQRYKCKQCSKLFTLNLIKHKTYPIKIILNAISYYNLGNSLKTSSEIINKQFKTALNPQTINNWLKEFKEICTFQRIRNKAIKYKKNNMITRRTFHHNQQPYLYQYHNSKIHFLKNYPKLKNYLIKIKDNCPNHLFNNNTRCSKINLKLNFKKIKKFNHACKLAELALKLTNDNKSRHQILDMLINDTATIATEIPVHLNYNDQLLTGHIDFLQLKFNKLYIIDYKPEAEKEKHAQSQIYLYTLALSRLTNTNIKHFICAYFNNKNYFEFYPKL